MGNTHINTISPANPPPYNGYLHPFFMENSYGNVKLGKNSVPYNLYHMNYNPNYQNAIVRAIRNKAANVWLRDEYNDLYKYFRVNSGGYVELIQTKEEYNEEKQKIIEDPYKNMNIKSNYIIQTYLTKDFVREHLHKYIMKSGTPWTKIQKYADPYIKDIFYKQLKKLIKNDMI